MTHDQALLFWGLLGSAGFLVATAVALLLREAAARDLYVRVQDVAGRGMVTGHTSDGPPQGMLAVIRRTGEWLRRSGKFYSVKDIEVLENIITCAGYDPRKLLPVVLGAKGLFLVLCVSTAAGYCAVTHANLGRWLLLVAVSLPIGIMVPESILNMLRRSHANSLRRGLPDALDLLVICAEAGLGLESAIEQVSQEMRTSNAPISVALANFLDELRVLPDRNEAFLNFGRRSGVEGIRRMSIVLAQTLRLGTPMGQAFRSMAVELRRERMVKLEEKAVRLPALLVFPLIFCILPTLLIILVGPSALSLVDTLRSVHTSLGR